MNFFRTQKIRACEGEPVSVAILGDIDFSTWSDTGVNPLELLKPVLSSVDFTIANIETVISDSTLKSGKPGILLKSPSSSVAYLKDAGVGYALLANNHIDDFGIKGLEDTIANLVANDINYFGVCKQEKIFVEQKGIKFCLSGFGTSWQNTSIVPSYGSLPGVIYKQSTQDSHLLYFVHGFEELFSVPFPWRLELLRKISDEISPAAIICGHSHCYQGWLASHNNCVTCLSYGNGFMNLKYHVATNGLSKYGCCSILRFDRLGCFQIDEYPYEITENGLKDISNDDKELFYRNLNYVHNLVGDTEALNIAWEDECFQKWKPRGMKNLPIIRSIYDWRRGVFPITHSKDGIVYLRAIKSAYLKRQYGVSTFALREDENIRIEDE